MRGVNEESKRMEVRKVCEDERLDVCGLSETKVKGESIWEWGQGWGVGSGVKEGRGREGVAIVVSERAKRCVKGYGCVSSRVVWVRLKVGRERWAVVCVYAPTNDCKADEREKFWVSVDECLEKFGANERVCLLGDMNGKVGEREDGRIVGKWGVGEQNENGVWLRRVCEGKGLVVTNTWFKHRTVHKMTWVTSRFQSMIDYVCVDERVRSRVLDTRVRRGRARGVSDHWVVVSRVIMNERWRKGRAGGGGEDKGEVRIRSERLKESSVREEYTAKLERVLSEVEEDNDVEQMWGTFKRCILSAAEETCGVKLVGKGKRRGNKWWNEAIESAVKEKRRAYDRWTEENDLSVKEEKRADYVESRRLVKRLVKESKKRVNEEEGRVMGEEYKRDVRKFWKKVKILRGDREDVSSGVKGKDGELRSDDREVRDRWKEYFEELLNVKDERSVDVSGLGVEIVQSEEREEREISLSEVKKALMKVKMGKAAGVDGVTGEMLRFGGEVVSRWLWTICKVAWEKGVVPEEWMNAVIVPIYKGKGDKRECGNYRGVSLLSVPGKVFGRVIMDRVKEATEYLVSEEQCGFRGGRGCIDQIFSVRQVVEKYLEKDRKLYIAFMDLEKAYDRVDRGALWEVLSAYGVRGKLLQAVKSFYAGSKACVRVGGETSDWFEIEVGVKQGCVMSPWLFNVFMDGVLRELKGLLGGEGAELMWEDRILKVSALLFADDTALFGTSEEELQRVVNAFGEVCKKRKLKVNARKSKVLVCEKGGGSECEIKLENQVLEVVNEFKYLGSVIERKGGVNEEVESRVRQGKRVAGVLRDISKKKKLSTEVAVGMYERVVVPTVTYACETWAASMEHMRRVKVVETSYLRGVCGVTRRDRVRNEEVYDRSGVRMGVDEKMKKRTLEWFGHVERMGEERLAKRIYGGVVRGERQRGRPRLRWTECVGRYLKERGVGMTAGRRGCGDRWEWRRFCNGHPLARRRRQEDR